MSAPLTRDTVLDRFDVDFERGRMFWKRPHPLRTDLVGKEAGGACLSLAKPYWYIKIGDRSYRRARLIFLAAHGSFPSPCVDHIDGDSLNDALTNLREATIAENCRNISGRTRTTDLPMGVRKLRISGRYQARIGYNKQQFNLGTYDTPEEAQAVYREKRRQLFGEFSGLSSEQADAIERKCLNAVKAALGEVAVCVLASPLIFIAADWLRYGS